MGRFNEIKGTRVEGIIGRTHIVTETIIPTQLHVKLCKIAA